MNNEESLDWDEVIREAEQLPAAYMREAFSQQSTHYLTLAMNATDPAQRDRYLELSVSFTEAAFGELSKEESE